MIRFLAVLMLLTGCTTTSTPAYYFSKHGITQPTLEGFPHCRGYGCHTVESVSLNKKEWALIGKGFPAKTAEAERAQIAKVIGRFETIVGPITSTQEDLAGTYINPGPFQLDCIDESTNTTIYLALMAQKNWLKFHDVMAPDTRVPFGLGVFAAHRTAVIKDKENGMRYAVDSWFRDNGKTADIAPMDVWKDRWHPEGAENVH